MLGAVGMSSITIHLQLLVHRVTERSFRQHAFDRLLQRTAGEAGLHLVEVGLADTTGIPAVTIVFLVQSLVAGDADTRGIDNDHEVPRVDVGRELGLVLAAKPQRDLGREASEDLVRPVDEKPLAAHLMCFGRKCFHSLDALTIYLLGAACVLPCHRPRRRPAPEEAPRELAVTDLLSITAVVYDGPAVFAGATSKDAQKRACR